MRSIKSGRLPFGRYGLLLFAGQFDHGGLLSWDLLGALPSAGIGKIRRTDLFRIVLLCYKAILIWQ